VSKIGTKRGEQVHIIPCRPGWWRCSAPRAASGGASSRPAEPAPRPFLLSSSLVPPYPSQDPPSPRPTASARRGRRLGRRVRRRTAAARRPWWGAGGTISMVYLKLGGAIQNGMELWIGWFITIMVCYGTDGRGRTERSVYKLGGGVKGGEKRRRRFWELREPTSTPWRLEKVRKIIGKGSFGREMGDVGILCSRLLPLLCGPSGVPGPHTVTAVEGSQLQRSPGSCSSGVAPSDLVLGNQDLSDVLGWVEMAVGTRYPKFDRFFSIRV
jgi:hypothetical protein